MSTRAFGIRSTMLAIMIVGLGCGESRRLVHSVAGPTLIEVAEVMVATSMEEVEEFRSQQFDYIDQLQAAIEDATARGEIVEAKLLRADLGDAQVATKGDWPSLKRQLDRDLDGAVMMRTAAKAKPATRRAPTARKP